MNVQVDLRLSTTLSLCWGQAVTITGAEGDLAVRSGRLWLTRDHDLNDHVLRVGERFMLRASDVVVIEPWQRDELTRVSWEPRHLRDQRRRTPDLAPVLPDARCWA